LPRALSKPHRHEMALCWTSCIRWESTEQITPAYSHTLQHLACQEH
jgi:hypothetical protein